MRKIFLDMDGTLAKFNVKNALKRFEIEHGFFEKLGAYKGIEIINEMAKAGNLYIISASPNERADIDKIKWILKYLPNMPLTNILLCRCGQNKAEVLKNKYNYTITKNDLLLDDYTKNLVEWERAGGVGIKRITTVADNSRKLWKGFELKKLVELQNFI